MSYREYIEQRVAEWQTPETILEQFVAGPDALVQALEGLSDESLDLVRAPDKWSIRQIVHHVIHGDDVVGMRIKAAIGSPGSTWDNPWYDHMAWVDTLGFGERELKPGLEFLRAHRRFVAHLVQSTPQAWERHVLVGQSEDAEGFPWTAGRGVVVLACHIPWHIEQIRETRQVHGV